MRRGLFGGAVLMFWMVLGLCQAEAIEYLSDLGFSSSAVNTTETPVRLSVDPRGDVASATPSWVLGAELRDAACPTCQFPDFFLPKDFHCIECPPINLGLKFPPTSFGVENKAVSVVLSNGCSTSLSLGQDTINTPVSCSQELNVFLYQESVLPEDFQLSTLQGLGGLRGLTVRFSHWVNAVAQTETCPSPVVLAATLVGIKFWNPFTQTVLNYQIVTFDSRGAEFDGTWWSFPAANGETVYGVNDSLGVYGMGTLLPSGGNIFSLNVLERVKELIGSNPFGLEADPRHWRVKGVYSGNTTNGQASIQSTQRFFPSLEGF